MLMLYVSLTLNALPILSVSNTLNNGQPDRLLTQWAFFMLIINKLHAESLANCPPLVGLWVRFCTVTRENQYETTT